MAELILELFSEEIPARMQKAAAEELKSKLMFYLKEQGLYHQKVRSFVTPRRLVVVADGLTLTQEEKTEEKRGPRTDAPEKAVEGFLRANHIGKADLIKKQTPKGEFYFAITHERGKPTKDILKQGLEQIIPSISWPKSMRWGNGETRWVRPLKNIACLFGGEVLPVAFGDLVANDNSQGHRFLGSQAFKIGKFEDYRKELKHRKVVLDIDERKQLILEQAKKLAADKQCKLIQDEALLEEVAGLVEWPVALMGKIDEHYMHVPEEALISCIRTHQKYFVLKNKEGKLAPYFIVISNMETADKGKQIIAGNERVLRARLADAKFFWEQDLKKPLSEYTDKLKHITFHARLGTVQEKAQRVAAIAQFLAVWVPHAKLEEVERAAKLCKADLATEMVGEFPELQGIMGYYYAREAGETEEIARAIEDHYKPLGAAGSLPTSPLSVAVALADKIDTLAGLFAVGEQPTGSKDPFALRRAALGVIRIILENRLNVPLRILIDAALKHYPKALFITAEEEEEERKKGLLSKLKRKKVNPQEVRTELLEFFIDRLKALLKGEDMRHDLINAVFAIGEDDLLRVTQRVRALDAFLKTENGKNMLAAHRRAVNILNIEEKKDNKRYKPQNSNSNLKQKEEKRLFTYIQKARPMIKETLKKDDFEGAMALLSRLRAPIDAFFEQVIVNAEDSELRRHRLKLLASLREMYDDVADFGKIEG